MLKEGTRRVWNPPNPYASHHYAEWVEEPPLAKLEIYEERAKSIIASNKSPDIGFEYSVNPYRGCFHACAYCYARPTHHYLDLGAGTDFERKIVVKINAATLLEKEFKRPSWQASPLVFSGVTDCYQPLELRYELTRACLNICRKYANAVSIITKGALVVRDIDILQALNENSSVKVYFSVPFSEDEMAKAIEPSAPIPSTRFRAMRKVSEAGIPVGVGIAPVIPGLNDDQIVKVLERARDCGAETAFMTLLRLPLEVKDVFIKRLSENFPDRVKRVLNKVREAKGNVLNRSAFGERFKGEGPYWEAVEWMFKSNCKRLGFNVRNGEQRDNDSKKSVGPQLYLPGI